jgi:hemolysin activation/secretion protein
LRAAKEENAPPLRHAIAQQTQMTITSDASPTARLTKMRATALVIIAALASGTARASDPAGLTTVVVEHSSVYAAPALFATYSGELGRPVTREGARTIVNAIAEQYVRDGYVKPEVAVVESDTAGILRVRVHEAQVTSVLVEGGGPFADELRDIGARLENTRPLRRDDIPRTLRDMRRFAGLAVTASTRRDPQLRNAFELVVRADFSPVDGVVRMNNRGTEQVGPAFMLGQVFANGLFGRGEKLGLIFAAATDHDEYLGGGLFFDSPLGSAGTRANALLFRSHSAPNEAPTNLDDEYRRKRLTLRVSHPLRQGSSLTLTASGAFEADDLTIDREGIVIREDRLRVAEAALRAAWRAGATQLSANLQLRHGLDGLGAGLDAPYLANDPRRADFMVTLAQATALRRFAERWSLRLDAFAQTSGYVLPDSERFKIGGDRLGRGFEVAEIAGDRGLGGKLELRRDLRNTETLVGRLSSYAFYDIGAAWKRDRPGRESAATAGLGLAMQGAELTGYLEVAAPLTGPDIEGQRDASVFAELSYRF